MNKQENCYQTHSKGETMKEIAQMILIAKGLYQEMINSSKFSEVNTCLENQMNINYFQKNRKE